MAEAIFRDLVQKEGLSARITVDSAGTGDWHIGSPPHKGTLGILKRYNINADGLVARKFISADLEDFDYIIGMDESNLENMLRIAGLKQHPKVIRMLDLTDSPADVPDPYYTGDFQETYDLLNEGCQRLLDKIKEDL